MRLTEAHLEPLRRDIPDPGHLVNLHPGVRQATDEDYAENVSSMLAAKPPGPFWIFAIGSLIWKPETAFVEQQMGVARGWHRRFCLGWDYRFRGSKETPGRDDGPRPRRDLQGNALSPARRWA